MRPVAVAAFQEAITMIARKIEQLQRFLHLHDKHMAAYALCHLDWHFRGGAKVMPDRFADWSHGEPEAIHSKHHGPGRPALRYREPPIKRDWLFV